MKTLIKTTLVAAVAMAGFSSFTASACNPWQPCVRTEVHVSRSVILPPPPPVCHYEWQESGAMMHGAMATGSVMK